jgi:1,5-anhydro-D-fructose reductase (1,5-anhydro-D-mannitol-forming)
VSRPAPIGIGLIGASTILTEFVHDALLGAGGFRLCGLLSSSPERGEQMQRRYGLPRLYDSLPQLLADPEVQAVYISTNHDLHHPQALACLKEGKHVLCEKPIALSTAQASELVRAAEDSGRVFATNHHFRSACWNQTGRRLIEEGLIGRPMIVRTQQVLKLKDPLRARRMRPPEGAAAGVIWDLTVHTADIVAFMLDEAIEAISAQTLSFGPQDGGAEHTAMGVMRTAGGVLASYLDSFESDHAGSAIEVHGDEATLQIDEALIEVGSPLVRLRTGTETHLVSFGAPNNLYEGALSAFRDAIRGEGEPAASVLDGARSVAVAEAARRAAASGATERVAAIDWAQGAVTPSYPTD